MFCRSDASMNFRLKMILLIFAPKKYKKKIRKTFFSLHGIYTMYIRQYTHI